MWVIRGGERIRLLHWRPDLRAARPSRSETSQPTLEQTGWHAHMDTENGGTPAENSGGSGEARPKGFEPLTF